MALIGIKELDESIGEIDEGKIIVIKGPPGTGKIVIGYSFLEQGVKKGQNCFYMFYKESVEQVFNDVKDFGIDASKVVFANTNNIFEGQSGYKLIVCDIYNPSTIDKIDLLFKTKKNVRGVITVLSQIFQGKSISTAFYTVNHMKQLLENYKKGSLLFTMEKGVVTDQDLKDVEDLVDIVCEMIPTGQNKGKFIINKCYKRVKIKNFTYTITKNKISLAPIL